MTGVRWWWGYWRGYVRGRLWLYGARVRYAIYFVRALRADEPVLTFDGWVRDLDGTD